MSKDNINLWKSLCEQGVFICETVRFDLENIIKQIDNQGYTAFEIKDILQEYIFSINKRIKSFEEGGK